MLHKRGYLNQALMTRRFAWTKNTITKTYKNLLNIKGNFLNLLTLNNL